MTDKDLLPPIEKIYEAMSAVADERVELKNEALALVTSSDRSKQYTISWTNNEYKSNDNATYWQGYIGYPIIAVLIATGKIHCDFNTMKLLSGTKWKSINKQHKSNYAKAVDAVLNDLATSGANIERIKSEVNSIMAQLASLDITLKRAKVRPTPGE